MRSSESGGGRRGRGRGRGLFAVTSAWLWVLALPAIALAADPSESPGGAAGDPRSSGQGPGLVGDPGWALLIVLAIGIAALLVTLAYVRLTAQRDGSDDR
jgi:hypothetical protein